MVIDIAAIIYMLLALYIGGAIFITGLLALGIWGFLTIRKRASRKNRQGSSEKRILKDQQKPKLTHHQAHAL